MRPAFRPQQEQIMIAAVSKRRGFFLLWIAFFLCLFVYQSNYIAQVSGSKRIARAVPRLRPVVFNLTDFGGIGDGRTINTRAFERAVAEISSAAAKSGGAQLNVPAGVWLTAPFNLTSHMTLFLEEDATILATQSEDLWPLMQPLPSYGRGRELPGPRYGSLIHGQHLEDIVITGHNGTIDGNGRKWWEKAKRKQLKHTRGRLIQLMWSRGIEISDVTLRNSPFWTVHPYDCENVTIRGVTIIAPPDAPNTDGIDPDSCRNVLIESCYISVGDDGVAVKSGWDQYGIDYGKPCANITIRNIQVNAPVSAGVSIGSEMSGGITNVTVENVFIWNSKRGVRIKTTPGRGGYVTQVFYRNITMETVRVGIVIKTDYGDHPDEFYDPTALPVVEKIFFDGIYGSEVRIPARIYGSKEVPVRGLEIRDMNVGVTRKKKHVFQCSFLQGEVFGTIFPKPCEDLGTSTRPGVFREAKITSESDGDDDA
ncbi:probable polygalacturonase [Selaginella moellendorffii]|nr:probable polygalacturonase [Selaginella moellendorffii]|eukprot:XP_002993619.2 probable polygalacturonase [Selaginella moellendorffii]